MKAKSNLHVFLTLLLILSAGTGMAQITGSPSPHKFHPALEQNRFSTGNFSSLQPLLIDQQTRDSLKNGPEETLWAERFRRGHLVRKSGNEFSIGASPLFDLGYYHVLKPDNDTGRKYVNGRGVFIEGTLGDKVQFHTWFMENQGFFPGYLGDFAANYGVVPGSGRTKPFKAGGVDYAVAGGMVSYTPFSDNFLLNIQAGHGKQFFGDGYRSLLLSDAGFVYPMLKVTAGKEKWRYQSTLTILQTLERAPRRNTPEAIFFRKNGSFHSLSILVHSAVELSFFEGIIWQVYDSTERTPLPVNFYFPLIFGNTLLYGLNNENNSVVGMNLRATLKNNYVFYGQAALDDLQSDRLGFQAGLRVLKVPGINSLMARVEVNKVNPYTFAHTVPRQSYTHYNQPIGHPLGSGFSELNGELRWNYRDLFIGVEGFLASKTDTLGSYNFGTEPLLPADVHLPVPGSVEAGTAKMVNGHGYVAYRINRTYDLVLSAGARVRNVARTSGNDNDMFVYLKLSTTLFNRNEDF